ncbi:MAG: helix-turn-helix transcriptional regulator [Verrucomicrobia bacterium]|jgi:AraC-like DNA-binding protein|nr:helix-turn-helix transcriptional regulator [Verrucomicrobiota bacterium]
MGHLDLRIGDLPRLMPLAPKVSSVGYVPSKTVWVRKSVPKVAFCFILRGRGRLRYGDRSFSIESPCVFVQWPGVHEEYGPELEGASWDEVFITYDPSLTSVFEAWDTPPSEQPIWPIASVHKVRRLTEELIDCMQNAQVSGIADRIDSICERMLQESRLAPTGPSHTPHDGDLDHIRAYLADNLDRRLGVKETAEKYGMSEVTFRRYWKQRFGTSFKQYLTDLRMQEARRLLETTNFEIKEIASRLGFHDTLYFSRRFSQQVGMPATQYRKQFGGSGSL